MTLMMGGALCKYELYTTELWKDELIDAEYDRQRAADTLHGRVRDRTTFMSRFKRIVRPKEDPFETELYRKTWERRGLVDQAAEHAFETGLAKPYADTSNLLGHIGAGNIRGNLEGKGSLDTSTGRHLTTEFGAQLRMPVANGQTIQVMSGMKDGTERAVDCFENRMNTVHVINDTYFVSGVIDYAAQILEVRDRVKTYSAGAVVSTEHLKNEMEEGKHRPGFEAVLISSVHRLGRLELAQVVENSHHLLADQGVLLVSGPVERPRPGNTSADEAITDAMEVFGAPEQVQDGVIRRSLSNIRHRQAVFRKNP
jgi:hypothetical protein